MPLADHVQARWSNADLVTLTRQGTTGPQTIDTDRLGHACDDAQAEFSVLVGLDYDDDDSEHVRVAVLGVIAHLHERVLAYDEASIRSRARWEKACADLAKARGSLRPVMPQTTSRFDPSQERDGERPAFDRRRQRGYVIGRRGITSRDDEE